MPFLSTHNMPSRCNKATEVCKHFKTFVTLEVKHVLISADLAILLIVLPVLCTTLNILPTTEVKLRIIAASQRALRRLGRLNVLSNPLHGVHIIILFNLEQMGVHPDIAHFTHRCQIAYRDAYLQQLVKIVERQMDRQ